MNTHPRTAEADLFSDTAVNLELLRRRAYNHRWAQQDPAVIPLTAADPDFPAPPPVREAIISYAQGGYFPYGPPEGLPEFRETVSTVVAERKGISVSPEQVLPIDSAARAMFVMARSVLAPGDEAIIFDPVDFLFKRSVEAAGAVPVYCPLDPVSGRFDPVYLESLVTPRTRMIGVCNPHNPLGHVLRADEVRTLAEFAARHDLWVMNDEIWSDIVYADDREDVAFHSLHGVASELTQKTVTIYGFSKTFAMAGLRAAFMLCPDRETADRFMQAADMPSTAGGVAPLVQVAATAAFTDAWPWVDAFVAHLQRQRDYAISRLSAMPGIQVTEPEGTYVLFPDITGLSMSSQETVDALHREARVALVPGTPAYFGPGGEGYIRICFATSQGILREGLDRIENWITRREVRAQNRSAPK